MIENIIEKCTEEEGEFIYEKIDEYNASKVPFTQDKKFIGISRVIKDEEGNIIAGIISQLYCWNCLYIDRLWVSEEHRKKGYGQKLLKEVEKIAKSKDCNIVHLDTFDFQAKDFYIKSGYEVFGVLDDCPAGHKYYFLKKKL